MKNKIMKRGIIFSIVALFVVAGFLPSTTSIDPTLEADIQQAINDGIAWLVSEQDEGGSWQNDVALTGFVLIKLQDRAYELGYESPFDPEYPYSDNVIAGWEYLFSDDGGGNPLYVKQESIGVQTYGDPDWNGNGNGIFFEGENRDVYYTGICLMALAASGTPDRPNDGGFDYIGGSNPDTFGEIAQEVVEWLAWAQEETGSDAGGWRYTGNYGSSDNSVSGYATLGLAAAEGFGCTVPDWVKTTLSLWIDAIQCGTNGGSAYDLTSHGACVWVNLLKTGNLLFEMTFVGDTAVDTRFQDALDFIETHWHDENYEPGWGYNQGIPAHYQSMYCLMKGLEYSGINLLDLDGMGSPEHDWYEEFATVLVAHQHPDGYWPDSPAFVWYTAGNPVGAWSGEILSTVWALLNLERIVPPPPVIPVYFDIKPGSCPNPIQLKHKGVTPVAILGTEDFDIMDIDVSTIMIGREGDYDEVAPIRCNYEDVGTPYIGDCEEDCCDDRYNCHEAEGDGFMDLTLKFDSQEIVEELLHDTEKGDVLCLYITGSTFEGHTFYGQDVIWIR